MINKDILKGIGLTENEAEIYLILLNLGEATVYRIADKSKISRPNIYDTIKKLIEKGSVSQIIKNNKKYFKPIAPDKLLDIIKEKEKNILEILPDLNKIYEETKIEPIIEIFQGNEGLKTIMNDFLKVKKEIWIFNAVDEKYLKNKVPEFFIKRFGNEKKRLNIKTNVLYSKEVKPFKAYGYKFKQLPENILSCVGYWVYGNRVAIGIWLEQPIIIRIISEDVAKTYLQSIKLIWNSLE